MRCLPASRSSAAKSRVAFELRPADRWGTDQRGEGHVVRLAMMSSLLAFPNSLVLTFLISGFLPPGDANTQDRVAVCSAETSILFGRCRAHATNIPLHPSLYISIKYALRCPLSSRQHRGITRSGISLTIPLAPILQPPTHARGIGLQLYGDLCNRHPT